MNKKRPGKLVVVRIDRSFERLKFGIVWFDINPRNISRLMLSKVPQKTEARAVRLGRSTF